MCGPILTSFLGGRNGSLAAGSPTANGSSRRPRSECRSVASGLIIGLVTLMAGQSLSGIALSRIAGASDELEPIPDADQPKLLERIRLELTEHQSSIDSIDVKWTRKSLADPVKMPRLLPFSRMQWMRSNRYQLTTMEGLAALEAPAKTRSRCIFDGEHGYVFDYHQSDPTKINSVRILDGEPSAFATLDISLLLGWNVVMLQRPICDLLGAGQVKLNGTRHVNGADCYEVQIGPTRLPGISEPVLVVAWFDAQQGWLPRRIRVCSESDFRDPLAYATAKNRLASWQADVQSFLRVSDPLHERTVLFPQDAEFAFGPSLRHSIHVDDVQLNSAIAPSVFRAEIPDAVQVEEHHGTPRYQRTITGGDAAKAEHERLLEADRVAAGLKQTTPALLPSAGTIDARPHPNSSLPGIMLGTSLLAFVAALGFVVARWLQRHS